MRVKTEYLVLAAVIAAAVIYLIVHQPDRERYSLPALPAVSTEEITRIDILRGGQTITLTEDGESWRITPGGYPADGARVKGLLSAVADLSVTALVSESKAWARYDLAEDKRIRVTAFAGDRPVRSVDIGKPAATFQHTFVKLPDDDRIYHSAGDLRRQFDRSAADLRDKVVMVFQPEKIDTITAATPAGELRLQRKPAGAQTAAPAPDGGSPPPTAAWVLDDGRQLAGDAVDPFLNRLNRMACDRFIEDRQPEALGAPSLTVTLGGEKPITLRIYPEMPEVPDGRPAVSSQSAQPFVLSSWQVEGLEEMIGTWRGTEKDAAAPPVNDPPKAP